ncbi:MAG: dihydrofolate synthase [Cytophagaceae bacterium SCN 52-12]|nr:MAG: dihydrofolate synthase [Cytophagaceae bacterium SCN 52-12]
MTFEEAMTYLYNRLPVFHNIGHRAYKPGLETTRAFCKYLGDPQDRYETIHVAGTNGKGSISNMLAAVLQHSGYRTGLYTSPHLKSFTERIRVNGVPADEDFVASFVSRHKAFIEKISPSFFEVTVAMAFNYFARLEVDIAVIEVGLGGRLDSTNIITPGLSVITNIGFDHMRQLGATLPLIAGEKAGIIKPGVPVVVSERQSDEITAVFEEAAKDKNAPLYFGSDYGSISAESIENGMLKLEIQKLTKDRKSNNVSLLLDLAGSYQKKNLLGVLTAVDRLNGAGWKISSGSLEAGLASVTKTTGFKGRWTRLGEKPFVVADTAHNLPGFTEALAQFMSVPAGRKHFVLGFVSDKDISAMLRLLPQDADYYFCAPSNNRALPAFSLLEQAESMGLKGEAFPGVNEALARAISNARPEDSVYVGGSTFVVADLDVL